MALLGFLACMGLYAWLWILGGRPVGWALLVIPILLGLTTLVIGRTARTEQQFDLNGLLTVGLLVRFAASYYRFDNAVDAHVYHNSGIHLADSFRALNFTPDTGAAVPGTGTMRYISGLVHVPANNDAFAAALIFSWLGFLGCYLLYRAFVIAVPDGDRYRYAKLLFLWPSLVLWPSSIGKESLMLLAIGIAALGTARLFTRRPGGYTLILFGIGGAYFIRPHVAMIALFALVVALIIGRGHTPSTGALTPSSVAKIGTVCVLLVATSVVATRTADYLGIKSLHPSYADQKFQETRELTGEGGSRFSPADANSPLGYPQAAVTILFRPFPFETSGLEPFLTSIEALGLALLTFFSWRRLVSVPWRSRAEPYVGFALFYLLAFFFVFAVISNFGILARERTMMLPFAFVLLSVTALPTPRERTTAAPSVQRPRPRAPKR